TDLVRILGRALGQEHSRRRKLRLQRADLLGRRRITALGRLADHRTLPPARLRPPRDRIHIQRCQELQRPWTATIPFDLMPDTEIMEHLCENEKDLGHMYRK